MNDLIIRNETREDYIIVEEIIREAFWNVNLPGCDEHYLAHILREHTDFVPELDLIARLDGRIVGNIMYTKSKLIDENGNEDEKRILTFGPISVLPKFQRKGIGKALMKASFEKAKKLGYDAVIIMGSPANYVSSGFKSCKKYNISAKDGTFPLAMFAKELRDGALDGKRTYFCESSAYDVDPVKAEEFDKNFEPKIKEYRSSQEEFYIYSRSIIV